MAAAAATITVLAGCNGAGKSSVAGAALEQRGGSYFNPDRVAGEIARVAMAGGHPMTTEQINGEAWFRGFQALKRAITQGHDFAFETTLGGQSVTAELERATAAGLVVRIWFVGLESIDLHIARVRSRVARGGHDIPTERIIQRYRAAPSNLVRLLPGLAELAVFDNSVEGDPASGAQPRPKKILHLVGGRLRAPADLNELRNAPEWTRPIVLAALRKHAGIRAA